MHVIVVGGGITGLAAALECLDRGHDVTLHEASPRLGGALATERRNGLLLERGPDSLIRTKPAAIALCERLHVDLIGTRPSPSARALIVRDGQLIPLPDGLQLLAPTKLFPFLASPLMSLGGKIRCARERFVGCRPGASDDDDESLADFVRRRFGPEALERLAQPLVAGIYSGDPEQLSLRSTMPRLLDLERDHGSVIKGMQATATEQAAGARYGLFATPASGMETLVDALAEAIELAGGSIVTGSPVDSLDALPEGQPVLLATPAATSAGLLRSRSERLASLLESLPTTSTATLNLVCAGDTLDPTPEGYGFVVPAVERRFVMACSFSSRKYEGRSPDDRQLLRAFVGGALGPDIRTLDDSEILERTLADLSELLGTELVAEDALLSRYEDAQPQYTLGHPERLAELESLIGGLDGIALAGNYLRGVGISDCIAGAHRAVEALLQPLLD